MKHSGVVPGLGKRLKQWRTSKNLKGYEVREMIKISPGSYSELETGKTLPSAGTLQNMILHTDLNIIWLLTSEGEMINEQNKS